MPYNYVRGSSSFQAFSTARPLFCFGCNCASRVIRLCATRTHRNYTFYFCAIGLDLFIPYMALMLHPIEIIAVGALNFIHFYINHYFIPLLDEYDCCERKSRDRDVMNLYSLYSFIHFFYTCEATPEVV
jgi:hypothetical protein